jgi:hypothetical protein
VTRQRKFTEATVPAGFLAEGVTRYVAGGPVRTPVTVPAPVIAPPGLINVTPGTLR